MCLPFLRCYGCAEMSAFEHYKVLVLVETPVDAMRLIAGGLNTTSVNLGSLSFDATRKMITETIAVNEQDVFSLSLDQTAWDRA